MGCCQSIPKGIPVEDIPTSLELRENKFQDVADRVPALTEDSKNNFAADELLQLRLEKTDMGRKRGIVVNIVQAQGSSSTKAEDENKKSGEEAEQPHHLHNWNSLYVESVYKFDMNKEIEANDLHAVHRGKVKKPLAYYQRDLTDGSLSRIPNQYKIFKETPSYSGHKALRVEIGDTWVDLYPWAKITFDMNTTIVSIRVFGAPKCKESDETPYRMRQANDSTWILYKYMYDDEKYKDCALIGYKGRQDGKPIYETTISPGIDPTFVICMESILDHFVESNNGKTRFFLPPPKE
jgi:hypothetical protein